MTCAETIRLRTVDRLLRDVQKGATLPDGVSEGCPLGSIKVPFQESTLSIVEGD